MKYLLDTNTCIRHLNRRSPAITARLATHSDEDIVVCAVVKAEMFTGAAKSTNPPKTLTIQQAFLDQFLSLPFDDSAAMIYGRVRGELEQRGTPIGPLDMMIAAIALANQVTLVTSNTREFSRVPGLQLENWDST
jgi:tRNA(fMet)-specific endonuclease VapC